MQVAKRPRAKGGDARDVSGLAPTPKDAAFVDSAGAPHSSWWPLQHEAMALSQANGRVACCFSGGGAVKCPAEGNGARAGRAFAWGAMAAHILTAPSHAAGMSVSGWSGAVFHPARRKQEHGGALEACLLA